MKRILPLFTVLLVVLVSVAIALLILRARSGVNGVVSVPAQRMFVDEWDVVSPNEADIPKLSKIQLLAEIEKSIKEYQSCHSWEAKYRVTSRQAPQGGRDSAIPEIIRTSQVRLISNGTKWCYDKQEELKDKTTNESQFVNACFVSNGQVISMVWPDRKDGQIQNSKQAVSVGGPTLVDFLPSLPTELLVGRLDFPDVLEILAAADTELLPWYTRIGNQTCYVLERTSTLRHPLFKNKEELESWKKENPEQAEAWSKAARYGPVFTIYPQGQPGGGDTRVVEMKFRLAIAPHFGFAIVRWAYGYGTPSGAYRGFIFPDREITYEDFGKVNKDLFVPHQMVYTNYRIDRHGQRRAAKETRLTIEEFAVNKQYQSKLFEFDFPKGYNIIDQNRGIVYTVGDSEEKIAALVTAAKAREAFYDKLRGKQSPSLEYSKWVNSTPIHLAEHKGRCITLHFWSIGCAPCIHELSWLQKQYGHTAEFSAGPLFISIHPFVDGDDLSQLNKIVQKYGLTFPVMVDSPDPASRSWGRTFKKYRIFGVPQEVKIDEKGDFVEIDKDLVSTSSWWFKNPGAK